MTPAPSHPDLTPDQESLLLAAVEGTLAHEHRAPLDQLLGAYPSLGAEVAAMRTDRLDLCDLDFEIADAPDLTAPVLARLAPRPIELRRMDLPLQRRRFSTRWASSALRPLAAAAAVLITAGFLAAYLLSQTSPNPAPIPLAEGPGDSAPPPDVVVAGTPESPDPATPTAPIPERAIAVAHDLWEADRTPAPDLERATALLAEGRLVVRVLAGSDEEAREGLDALHAGLDAQSTAWSLAGRLDPRRSERWNRPWVEAPLLAFDDQTRAIIEVPRPGLMEVWSARIEIEPAAIASLVHVLSRPGWTVRLEESPEPIELDPDSLQHSIWWTGAPSTWKSQGSAPIVIDALGR